MHERHHRDHTEREVPSGHGPEVDVVDLLRRTLERFERDLHEYRDRIVDLDEVIRAYDGRRKAGWEMAASHLMTWAWRLRRRSVRRRLSGSGAYNDRAKADE